jgi:hypothetical protein
VYGIGFEKKCGSGPLLPTDRDALSIIISAAGYISVNLWGNGGILIDSKSLVSWKPEVWFVAVYDRVDDGGMDSIVVWSEGKHFL